jgi:hypothetical protein
MAQLDRESQHCASVTLDHPDVVSSNAFLPNPFSALANAALAQARLKARGTITATKTAAAGAVTVAGRTVQGVVTITAGVAARAAVGAAGAAGRTVQGVATKTADAAATATHTASHTAHAAHAAATSTKVSNTAVPSSAEREPSGKPASTRGNSRSAFASMNEAASMTRGMTFGNSNSVSPSATRRTVNGAALPARLSPLCTAAIERLDFIDANADGSTYWFPDSQKLKRGIPDKRAVTGVLSPCSPLTAELMAAFRTKLEIARSWRVGDVEQAGVQAASVAFAYPLGAGGSDSCTKKEIAQLLLLLSSEAERKFVQLGGFIFFDKAGHIVIAVAITDTAPKREQNMHIAFDGPYEWQPGWSEQLKVGRVQHVAIPELLALGIRGFAWLLPNESFLTDPAVIGTESSLCSCPHGGFAFCFGEDYTQMAGYFALKGKDSLISTGTARLAERRDMAERLQNFELVQDSEIEIRKQGRGMVSVLTDMIRHVMNYVIDPDNTRLFYFNLLITAEVLIILITLPYSLAFSERDGVDDRALVRAGSLVIEISFILDVILTFRTGYYAAVGDKVMALPAIRKRYLRGWFAIDCMSRLVRQWMFTRFVYAHTYCCLDSVPSALIDLMVGTVGGGAPLLKTLVTIRNCHSKAH